MLLKQTTVPFSILYMFDLAFFVVICYIDTAEIHCLKLMLCMRVMWPLLGVASVVTTTGHKHWKHWTFLLQILQLFPLLFLLLFPLHFKTHKNSQSSFSQLCALALPTWLLVSGRMGLSYGHISRSTYLFTENCISSSEFRVILR